MLGIDASAGGVIALAGAGVLALASYRCRQRMARLEADHRCAEKALRESESRYRRMFAANPQAMYVYDRASLRILDANDAALAQYGYAREAFLALTILDLRPPEEAEKLRRFVAGLPASGLHDSGLWTHRRRDGTRLEVTITSHDVGDGTRLVTAQDVTERRRAERAHAVAEDRFRALAEQSLAGIYLFDGERVSYINPKGAALLGRTPQEVIGRPVIEFVHPEDRPLVLSRYARREKGENLTDTIQVRALHKDGRVVVIGTAANSSLDHGRPVIIGVMQDITDKAAAEAQVREYIQRLEHAVHGTVNAVSRMMDLRDPYTSGHEVRVGTLAAALAGELGMDGTQQDGLRICGAVHDVGKITVPAEILSKPARLSEAEFAIVRTHAAQGYEVLKDIDSPWPLAEVARQHHERMDGSGYPRGLKGEQILPEARILAVADVVESMGSHRPYRPRLGIDKALAEIEGHAGALYDPGVAQACLTLFRQRGFELPD